MKRGHTAWRLDEQMYNRIRLLSGFYLGTEDTIQAIANTIRLPYEIPNVDNCRMLPKFRGSDRLVLTEDYWQYPSVLTTS